MYSSDTVFTVTSARRYQYKQILILPCSVGVKGMNALTIIIGLNVPDRFSVYNSSCIANIAIATTIITIICMDVTDLINNSKSLLGICIGYELAIPPMHPCMRYAWVHGR